MACGVLVALQGMRPSVGALALRRGLQAQHAGQWTAARAWLALAWRQQPDDGQRAWAYAQVLERFHDRATLISVLRTAQESGASLPADAFLAWARAHEEQGHPAAAREVLVLGLRAHPRDGRLWRAYARLLDVAYRWAEAGQAWQRAARYLPGDRASQTQALLHQVVVAPQAVRIALRTWAREHPAGELLARALDATDLSPGVQQVAIGRGLAALGRWDLATWAWCRAVQRIPGYAPAWAYLSEGYRRLDWPRAAHGAWWVARHLAPRDPLPALMAARWAAGQGRPLTALAWYRRAWSAAPADPALAATLANALVHALPGQLPAARALLHYPPRARPHDPATWLTLARLALQWDLVEEEALPALRQVLRDNPDDPRALALLGHAYARRGEWAVAERFLVQALRRAPGLAEAHLYLGWVYLAEGRSQAAQEHLRWALALAAPNDPIADLARRSLRGEP